MLLSSGKGSTVVGSELAWIFFKDNLSSTKIVISLFMKEKIVSYQPQLIESNKINQSILYSDIQNLNINNNFFSFLYLFLGGKHNCLHAKSTYE